MINPQEFESSNINSLWLQNIYENIKNLENMFRMARDGCRGILEYTQVSQENKDMFLVDVQYKNLRLILTELKLLIDDTMIVIGEDKGIEFLNQLEKIEKIINIRKLFVKDNYSATKNAIVNSSVTTFFMETLTFFEQIRRKIFKELAPLLYHKQEDINKKKW